MSGIEKHREELDTYAVDFVDELAKDASTIAQVLGVQVERYQARAWTDVTGEFITATPEISGSRVAVELKEAAVGEQARGPYRLEAKIRTSSGRVVVGVAPLKVEG